MEEDAKAARQIKIQMEVVQNVRDQLENALNSLKALGGGVGGGEQVSHLHSIISRKLSVGFTFTCFEGWYGYLYFHSIYFHLWSRNGYRCIYLDDT
jgi:hypothetical protein